MKTESEKCAEVFRLGPGRFTFFCAYCTEQFEMHYDALDHIETHFALKNESCTNVKANLKDPDSRSTSKDKGKETSEFTANNDTKPSAEFDHELLPSISPISFSNDFDGIDEVKVEPDLVIPQEMPAEIKKKSTRQKSKSTKLTVKRIRKPKMTQQEKDWSEWGWIRQRGNVECDTCGARTLKRNIIYHMQTHSDHREFVCSICQKGFFTKTSLTHHVKIHTENRRFCCHICPNRFNSQSNLDIHIRTHTGEKQFKCNVCGKAFTQSSTLYVHMRIHTGEKPYQCELCDKSFSTSSSYCTHKRRHLNERKYKCNSCDMSFINKQYLRFHSMTHTGERPFSCDICPASFSQKHQLNQHILIHTDIKPYKCRFCDLHFSQSARRRTHERNVHNDICRQPKVAN